MKLFDIQAYHLHQQRAKKTFHDHDFLYQHVRDELLARLQDFKARFLEPLTLSPLPSFGIHHAILEDYLSFPKETFDLILSCLQAHWINDLPGHLKSIHHSLKKEGLFLGALWGGRTLYELRESLLQAEIKLTGGASPRMAPLLHPTDASILLGKAGFFMPVVDTEIITVTYPSILNLITDLRGMGETNKLIDRPKTFTSKLLFKAAEEIYHEAFGNNSGTLPATFEVIYLTGWKHA
ncbi:MAG: methyltransferase domain-containing protein [Proteobacteria bacterium]|nr:methyltransferase domain-containing protein [Pseudomonadota bacterium]